MKKKRRAPETKQSAFESARAALERAGEEEPSGTPTAQSERTPETVDSAEAPVVAVSESADSAEETSAPVESAETPVEVDDAKTPAEASATPEAVDGAETSVEASATPEARDGAETPAEASATPEAVDGAETPVEAFAAADNAETPATVENIPETPDAESSDSVSPPSADASAADVVQDAQSSDAPPDSSEEEADEDDEDEPWEMEDEAEAPEPENVETERRTMETKEITLGYRRSSAQSVESEAEAVKTPKEREAKSRFKALDQFKDAFRAHTDQQNEDGNPSSGSSRDAALRKRVMRIEDDETRSYLLDRILPQMTWYSKKSAQYQKMYYRLMAAGILMGALIPVFSVGGSYSAVKVILALLGVSVTAINAYLALHKYQELWVAYRNAREDLIHTLYSYFNQAGIFAQRNMTQKELDVLLVEVCENALSKENGGWTTTILQKM